MKPDREQQLHEALERMGNTHSLQDILAEINAGTMQSFVEGETWAVTRVIQFPQRKVLEIIWVIGDMPDAVKLHDVVMAYAAEQGCDLIRTFARDGWQQWAKKRGWQNGMRVYVREV
jgi:hypothetical protein